MKLNQKDNQWLKECLSKKSNNENGTRKSTQVRIIRGDGELAEPGLWRHPAKVL